MATGPIAASATTLTPVPMGCRRVDIVMPWRRLVACRMGSCGSRRRCRGCGLDFGGMTLRVRPRSQPATAMAATHASATMRTTVSMGRPPGLIRWLAKARSS